MHKLLVVAALSLPIVACADMTPTQQRALTGTAAGAGVGAAIGAIGGNAALGAGVGAGAGLLGLVPARRSVGPRATSRVPTGIGGRSPRGVTSRPDNSPRAGKPGAADERNRGGGARRMPSKPA